MIHPGITHDNIDPAEPGERFADELCHTRLVRHIGRNHEHFGTRGTHIRLRALEVLRIPRGEHHAVRPPGQTPSPQHARCPTMHR